MPVSSSSYTMLERKSAVATGYSFHNHWLFGAGAGSQSADLSGKTKIIVRLR